MALVFSALIALSVIGVGTAQAAPGALVKAVTTPFTTRATGVVVDRQNRIVMAGWSATAGGLSTIQLERYNADDTPDTSFGLFGTASLSVGPFTQANAVAIDSQNRIVVAGTSGNCTCGDDSLDFLVARFLDNGQLDTSFNNGLGWTTIDFSGNDDEAFALLLDADDNIIVGGDALQTGFLGLFGFNTQFAIAKLRKDGQLDTSFSRDGEFPEGGKLVTDFDNFEIVQRLTFDLLGRIVAVGSSFGDDDTFSDIAIARYTFDGHLDGSFGDGGKVKGKFGGARFSWPHDVMVTDDGIIIAGLASPGSHAGGDNEYDQEIFIFPFNNSNLAMVRYDNNGNVDPTFGSNGAVQTDIAGLDDSAQAMTIDHDGRILLAGWCHVVPDRTDVVVARYDKNGHLDPRWGSNGVSTASFIADGQAAVRSQAHAIDIDSFGRGRIVVAGQAVSTTGSVFLAYARFDVEHPDFALSTTTSLGAAPAGSVSTPVIATSIDGFTGPVFVTVAGSQAGAPLPAGLSVSFNGVAGNTTTLQVPAFNAVSATMTIAVAPTVRPQRFTLWLLPDSDPLLTHTVPFSVTVTAQAASIVSMVDIFRAAGAIDSDTVANGLKATLNNAQAAADAGDITKATQQLSGFLVAVELQRGKHIATSATIDGVPCNPVDLLLANGRDAVTSLQINSPVLPIVGYVINDSGQALRSATVTLFDASGAVVASAQSDVTGLYRLISTTALTPGATYTASVTSFPAVFTSSTPSVQTITWQSAGVALEPFVLELASPKP